MKFSKTKICYLIFLFIFFAFNGFSQNSSSSDSVGDLIRRAKSDTSKVNLYNKLFKYFNRSDSVRADSCYSASFRLAQRAGYDNGITDAMAAYAGYLITGFKNDRAIILNNKAISGYMLMLQTSGGDMEKKEIYNKIARCHLNNGFAYSSMNNYDKSIVYFKNALMNFEVTGNLKGISLCYNNMAISYKDKGDYSSSIEYNQKLYIIARQLNDKILMAGCVFNIASVYEHLGNYTNALKYIQLSLKISESQKFGKGIAKCYNSMGTIHYKQKNYQTAVTYFLMSLKIKQKINDKPGLANCFNNIGLVYMSTGKNSDAVDNFNKALDLYSETQNKQGESFCLNNLAMVNKSFGNYAKSLGYLQKSLFISKSINDVPNIALMMVNIADVLNLEGKYNEAVSYSRKGLEISRNIHSLDVMNQAYSSLSLSYEKLNNPSKSLEYFKLFSQTNDSLFNKEKNKQLVEMEAGYQLENKQKEIENLNRDKTLKDIEIKRQTAQKLAYLLGLLLMLIVAIGIFKRYYDKRKANQVLTLQKVEISEKNAELQSQNEEILSQKSRLEENLVYTEKLQEVLKSDLSKYKQVALKKLINPHFIFNSLNSIQSFILQNDKLQASIYLSKFSDLMRKTLDYSQKDYISLNEELEALMLYMELEQKRFEGKFKFEINTDPKIDKNECRIPPMILQPFVENSIWHGFMYKENEGKLAIRLLLNDSGNMVICTIEDNGIGRERAGELNKNKPRRESHGIEITNQRLSIFNSLQHAGIEIAYYDLKDQEGKSAGTRVVFNFPYLMNGFE